MNASDPRRVTANLPTDLLEEACAATGRGITETLIEGLLMIRRAGALKLARKLRGKIDLSELDLDRSRERARR